MMVVNSYSEINELEGIYVHKINVFLILNI